MPGASASGKPHEIPRRLRSRRQTGAISVPPTGAEEAGAGERGEAAARKERMKERTPRVDRAELLRRTFDFDVFACVRCGGRRRVLAYVRKREGCERFWSTWDCLRQVRAWPQREGHPRPRGVEAQAARANRPSPLPRPPGRAAWAACAPRGCTAAPAWLTARGAPVSGPPRPLCSNPHPQHGPHSSYAHALASRFGPNLVRQESIWSPKASRAPLLGGGRGSERRVTSSGGGGNRTRVRRLSVRALQRSRERFP